MTLTLGRKYRIAAMKEFESVGRWALLERRSGVGRNVMWLCRCACGTERLVRQSTLAAGKSSSCGCLRPALLASQKKTHGLSKTRTYRIWVDMHRRCSNQKHNTYKDYGGRGISVCQRWELFENFYADMGICPPGMSIDREDNEKGYEPGNCRWATAAQQGRNKRNNVFLTHDGQTKCLAEWADEIGMDRSTLSLRIKAGWSAAKALTAEPGSVKPSGRPSKHKGAASC
jgi:hypothetical protein